MHQPSLFTNATSTIRANLTGARARPVAIVILTWSICSAGLAADKAATQPILRQQPSVAPTQVQQRQVIKQPATAIPSQRVSAVATINQSDIESIASLLQRNQPETALRVWQQALTKAMQGDKRLPSQAVDRAISEVMQLAYPDSSTTQEPNSRATANIKAQSNPAALSPRDATNLQANTGEMELADNSQLKQMNLQSALQRRQQSVQMMAAMSKKMHDTAKNVIQNMK